MDSVPDTRPIRRRRTVWLVASLLLVSLLACLGLVSFMTSMGIWDGLYPAGEYRLKIQDENGTPINGATLNVLEGRTKNVAFEYPIDNYFSEGDLVSDEQGVIVALHKPRGFEFGGTCWNLFWIFPVCSDGPEFDFQISAAGYKSIKFSTDDLFEPAYNGRSSGNTKVELANGESLRIPVYELMFTLER